VGREGFLRYVPSGQYEHWVEERLEYMFWGHGWQTGEAGEVEKYEGGQGSHCSREAAPE